jgi:hypothetical protein
VDEIATTAVAAEPLLRKGMAALSFIGSIVFHIDPQLLRAMRELALGPIRTLPLLHEIFAERTLGLGASPTISVMRGAAETLPLEFNVFALSRGL